MRVRCRTAYSGCEAIPQDKILRAATLTKRNAPRQHGDSTVYSFSVIKNLGKRGDHACGLARDGECICSLSADIDNAREMRLQCEN
jgi:hypothetical protein